MTARRPAASAGADEGVVGHVEELEDPAEGLHGVGGVQRGEHEVAGFGGLDAGEHRFAVAHLADHDDIGILPDGGPQRGREVRHVDADLALTDVGHRSGGRGIRRGPRR
jgi:hypothetical protein